MRTSTQPRRSHLTLVVATLLPACVLSFTTPLRVRSVPSIGIPPMRTYSPSNPSPSRNVDLLQASVASADSADAESDAMLRKFEKKEAAMNQRKLQAMAKLNEVEQSLEELQTKKQEYLNGANLAKSPPGGNFSETTARSAVKALLWRVIAGSVTFITSLRFSGSLATALSIVGSDFFSKAFTMFIGERLMNKSQAGRKSGSDGAGRSLAKALIWRLFAIANTLTMAVFISKDLSIASKIAGSDAFFKTGLMFLYERVWARIEWGKKYEIEFSI